VDPTKRLSGEEIFEHPWLQHDGEMGPELKQCKEEMTKYNARRRLKKAANSVIAANRFKSILTKLHAS